MKISKYIHSCLLFELDGYKLLVDPGMFTFAEGLVSADAFDDVDSIIITHTHPDHLDINNLKNILERSKAAVYTNSEVGAVIQNGNIAFNLFEEGVFQIGPVKVEAIPVQHEPLLDSPIPQMTALLINDKVLHPVDSMEDKLTAYQGIEVLAMVTMAPFTNELKIAAFADKLRPKQILPVHDGFAKEFFVKSRYANYAKHFEKLNVKFHQVFQPGDSITI